MLDGLVIFIVIVVLCGVLYRFRHRIVLMGFDHRGNLLPTEEELDSADRSK